MSDDDKPRIVPVAEVHRLDPEWPFSPATTYRMVRKGRLKALRIGVRWYLRESDLIAFLAQPGTSGGGRR